jgi:hypothetical protein
MQEILLKIRWNIDFIKEEAGKVPGSYEIKEQVLNACEVFNNDFGKCFDTDMGKEKIKEIVAPALREFDRIIDEIKADDENKALFMLLITHVADIKFLLSSEEEQKIIK